MKRLALVAVSIALGVPIAAWAAVSARTVRASLGSSGQQANGASSAASISGDGRFVAFASDATNLVRGDSNRARDVFVRDLKTGRTVRVSVSSSGAQANGASVPNPLDQVAAPSISGDGRLVTFGSGASNLVAGDTNRAEDCFVHNLQTLRTQRVSVSATGAQGTGQCGQPVISGDGQSVAFISTSRLMAGDTGQTSEIFVRNLKTGQLREVSKSSAGAEGNGPSFRPTISYDGRLVAFESQASNLVAGDTNNAIDVFVFDTRTEQLRRLSVGTGGQGNENSFAGAQPSISLNDRYIVFYTNATNLVAGDSNLSAGVILCDLRTGTLRRVSVSSAGAQANEDSLLPTISGDGRYVAFESAASNLSPGDTPGSHDVFVRDLRTNRTERLPHTTGGNLDLSGLQYERPDISADGRYVSFASLAASLVAGDSNGFEDVFVNGPLH